MIKHNFCANASADLVYMIRKIGKRIKHINPWITKTTLGEFILFGLFCSVNVSWSMRIKGFLSLNGFALILITFVGLSLGLSKICGKFISNHKKQIKAILHILNKPFRTYAINVRDAYEQKRLDNK